MFIVNSLLKLVYCIVLTLSIDKVSYHLYVLTLILERLEDKFGKIFLITESLFC